jgi:hypothetical protein
VLLIGYLLLNLHGWWELFDLLAEEVFFLRKNKTRKLVLESNLRRIHVAKNSVFLELYGVWDPKSKRHWILSDSSFFQIESVLEKCCVSNFRPHVWF